MRDGHVSIDLVSRGANVRGMDEPVATAECAPPLAGVKRCFKCEEVKPHSEFYVKRKETGLLHHMCKRCCIEREKQRARDGVAWSVKPENKSKINERQRERYWEDPEKARAAALKSFYDRHDTALQSQRQRYKKNRKRNIEKSLKWNRENPDRVRAWKEANRPRIRASVKKHRINHPESAKISRDARRARRQGAKCERIKMGYRGRLMAWQNNQCPYCRVDLRTVVRHDDHVIPLAKGGRHSESNLQITCGPCNLRKSSKHPLDFAAEMGIVQNPLLIAI